MITHIPTGVQFETREIAKKVMGVSRYRAAAKAGDLDIHGLNLDYIEKMKRLKKN